VTVQPDTALASQYARGFQQQQHSFGSSSPLSDQLHQLAWLSILITSKQQRAQEQQQQQQQWHNQQQHGGDEESGPLAELKQKLRAYLTAHMQWRRQQQYAPPLAPAEKWVTLEHAEQVGLHASVDTRVSQGDAGQLCAVPKGKLTTAASTTQLQARTTTPTKALQTELLPPPACLWSVYASNSLSQALDFITSMTNAVHQQLLCRHLGLPPLAQQRHSSAAFGSSASRDVATGAAAAVQAAQAAADEAQQQAAAAIKVSGASVDMSKARRIAPTCPLKAPARVVPVFVVPRPNGQASSSGSSAAWQSRPQASDRLAFEPLQGWQTVQEQQAGLPCLMPTDPAGQHVPLSQCTAGRWPGSERREPGGPQTLPRDSSFKSSESSWGGGLSTHRK
jgi:hypothetical protein